MICFDYNKFMIHDMFLIHDKSMFYDMFRLQ
jgi:hypothetical protein